MATKDEEIERLKSKLKLYGSYTRERNQIEQNLHKYQNEVQFNNMPLNAAHNLGFYDDGPYNDAVKKMNIQVASYGREIEAVEEERSYLGIDEFISQLSSIEYKIIMKIYVDKFTYQELGEGNDIDYSQTSCYRIAESAFERWNTFREK